VSGLRQRKKDETRAKISNVGTFLFFQHGFDNVTMTQIADAANVSRMTVFNYFRRKEDIFFDRQPEATQLLADAILERPRGATVLQSLRALVLGLLSRGHPFVAVSPGVAGFWKTVSDSDALRRAAGELLQELHTVVAEALAKTAGLPARDPIAALAASMILAVHRTAYEDALRRLRDGETGETARRRQRELVHKGFDMLEAALARTPFGRARG
jgi:AcrR family transcriptional regulator